MAEADLDQTPHDPFAVQNRLMELLVWSAEQIAEFETRAEQLEVTRDMLLGRLVELEENEHLDPLTGLSNRRALIRDYEGLRQKNGGRRASDKERHSDQPNSLLSLDLDHFKDVNDTQGHGRGDEVLVEVAGILTSDLRKSDLVCRIGGEEFTILLPRTGIEAAEAIAEALREKVEARGTITASLGVTEISDEDELEVTLRKADTALYRAKDQGRNQVVVYDPSMPLKGN